MDGHFVPNLTIGPVVAEAVAKAASKPLDVHLMVENNSFFVDIFAPLKPEYISFHMEEEKHPHRLVQKIRSLGIKPSIALNPHMAPEVLEFLVEDLDMVLLMSVNPGFGGQKFIPSVLERAVRLKELIEKRNPTNCGCSVNSRRRCERDPQRAGSGHIARPARSLNLIFRVRLMFPQLDLAGVAGVGRYCRLTDDFAHFFAVFQQRDAFYFQVAPFFQYQRDPVFALSRNIFRHIDGDVLALVGRNWILGNQVRCGQEQNT